MTDLSKERLRSLRVMIVEDDQPTRLLIRSFMEHLLFNHVTERENG
ncbi:hypothetical protein [Nisaea sp.]